MKKQKGFTLIELLVVIAIIAILAAVVLVSLGNARQDARDSSRRADINSIMTAMELYANNNAGAYPATGVCAANGVIATASPGTVCAGSPLADATTTYISSLPTDPGTTNYTWSGNAAGYTLTATLENPPAGITQFVCSAGACADQ